MAMLAEQKSKQKWSEDPRNMKWSSDKDRYGYQMLEKMGWADGKGLGKKKSGTTSHVKIKKRKNNLGLGAKETHDNDWIAQQQDFNNLLSALQTHGGNAELRSKEQNNKAMLEVAKASRKRVFYKKFIQSKDTSQYSKNDMASIFGSTPSQSAPVTPLSQSEDEVESEDSAASCPTTSCSSGLVTYTSKQNIQEYFARRMKDIQSKKVQNGIESTKLENEITNTDEKSNKKREEDSEIMNSKKKKKRKRSKVDNEIVSENLKSVFLEANDYGEKKLNKKSKKNKRDSTLYEADCEENEDVLRKESGFGLDKCKRKKSKKSKVKKTDKIIKEMNKVSNGIEYDNANTDKPKNRPKKNKKCAEV